MINFIIYEDDKKFRNLYISTILKIIGNKNIAYKIIEIDRYTNKTLELINNLYGKKIYILGIEVPGMSGLELAKLIRKNNDWTSQIIISTSHERLEYTALKSKLLILDYITKYLDCSDKIKESISVALKILDNEQSLNFQYNGEIHQIPYQNILFIERDIKNDLSIIKTINKQIEINKSINEIEELLKNNISFFRTHRSCIINVNNISSFKLSDSIIYFNKHKTDLITRDKKKELKEILLKK